MQANPVVLVALSLSLFLLGSAGQVTALDWNDTEIQALHGGGFREPVNPRNVAKDIVTIQHADGYSLGRNFLFLDLLKSDSFDRGATEAYSEAYTTLSLSKLSGHAVAAGPVRDFGLTAGINYGHKSYPDYNVEPRVYLPGITLDFDLPGFAFFNLDLLAYIDRGSFDGRDNGCHATSYQVTPSWKLPFAIGSARFSIEGFADFIGAHGNCAAQILTQPQLRWDMGNQFGKPDHLYAGIEYQYWHNKFGVAGLRESFPQALLLWKF